MARLPGKVVATLDAGGDIGEAYAVTTKVERIASVRPLTLEPVPTVALADGQAVALVPAPNLTTFIGQKTVLIVDTDKGGFAGYQHGSQIWEDPAVVPGEPTAFLKAFDGTAITSDGQQALVITPETGALVAPHSPCDGIPVANVPTGAVYSCQLSPNFIPAQTMRAVKGGRIFVVGNNPDNVYAIDQSGKSFWHGSLPSDFNHAAVAPDGSAVYLATASGLRALVVGSETQRALSGEETFDVGVSRDGSLVYALTAHGLEVIESQSGNLRATYQIAGTGIQLVAGG